MLTEPAYIYALDKVTPFSFQVQNSRDFVFLRSDIVKEIEIYCRNCKKNMGITYSLSGNMNAEMLTGISIKCHTCKKVLRIKRYTEEMIVKNAYSNGKLYI